MELLRALAAVIDRPARVPDGLLDVLDLPGRPDPAAHTDVFTFELPPYASVYVGEEGMLGGEARDRVAGFFRALSVTPPAEPDHLVVLLHAAAELAEAEAEAVDRDAVARHRRARAALLREHLLPWLPIYLSAVARSAPEPYQSWAQILTDTLRRQAEELGTGEDVPRHLAAAPGLPDPRSEEPKDLPAALLVPVRAGFLVTRSMLADASRDLRLALRIGERRYVLRNLLDQDPAALLSWLASRAAEAPPHYAADFGWAGPSTRFWRERATASAELLEDVAGHAAQALRLAERAPS